MCGYHRFLTVSLIENEYKKKKKDRGSTGRERLTQPGACTIFLKTGTRQFESKMDHRWSTLTLYSSLISVHVLFVATAHLALLCHLNVSLWMHIPLVFTAAPKEHSTLSFNPFKLSLFLYRCPLRVALCRSLYLFTLTLHRVDLLPSFCVLAVFWLICGCSHSDSVLNGTTQSLPECRCRPLGAAICLYWNWPFQSAVQFSSFSVSYLLSDDACVLSGCLAADTMR